MLVVFTALSVVISSEGIIVDNYRKIHLFDIDIKNGPRMKESDVTVAGDRINTPIASPIGNLGLSICYDLRFPGKTYLGI
jgi:predicted amidohydrolase